MSEVEEVDLKCLDVPINDICQEIGTEMKQAPAMVASVTEAMERNCVSTLSDFQECVDSGVKIPGLPALFVVRLKEKVKTLRGRHTNLGPTLTQIENAPELNADEEDAEQNRIVKELAEAFEADQKHKVLCKIFVNKLENLSTAEWTIGFDIGVQCWFISEAHVGWKSNTPSEDVFKPDFEFMGATSVEPIVCVEEGGSFYIRERYKRWGIINWYQVNLFWNGC
jgi:hypothetical protein